jgi:hypothetical protein
MPHIGPLNSLASTAYTGADLAVKGYLNDLSALLVSKGGAVFNYKVARNAAEELRYTWVLQTGKKLNQDVQAIVDGLKKQNMAELQPLIEQIEHQRTLLPGAFSLTALFNTVWDKDIWQAINVSRAQWHSLSGSLWRIADQAQTTALALIEQASREGLAFNKVKADLEALLTEKGAASMEYNVRRLWATELRRNRIVAEQTIWKSVGVVKEVKLYRAADADLTCQLCGNAIGYKAGDERIVPFDWPEMPPYHPWCKCNSRPVEPTKKELKTYLDKKYGELPLAQFQGPSILTALLPKGTPAQKVPTHAEVEQAFQDAHIEDNLRDFDKQLDKMFRALTKQGWLPIQNDNLRLEMHSRLDHMVGQFGTPKWTLTKGGGGSSGGYYWQGHGGEIIIDPKKFPGVTRMLDVSIHEYGHYLANVLDDMSTMRNTWLNGTQLNQAREAIQAAMGQLKDYAFRTMTETIRAPGKMDRLAQQILNYGSKTPLPQNVLDLQKAAQQLKGMLDSNAAVGRQFGAGFWDLTGGRLPDSGAAHAVTYFKRTDYMHWPKTGNIGMVEQETLNEFTTGYLLGNPGQRAVIDDRMYDWVPDLWTAMHRWIDLILGI